VIQELPASIAAVAVVRVESLTLATALLAFVAGLVSFVSPCVLPLLPAYLSYVSGVSVERLEGERADVLVAALAFVAGFTTVFVLLGAAAGGIGSLIERYKPELTFAAGVFLIVSGLVVAGIVRLPGLHGDLVPRAGGLPRAFLTGAAVSIGWTPCVGYVLGGILMVAGSRQSAGAGALLLLIYSLGLGLPFVLAALAFDWVSARTRWLRDHYRAVQTVSGILLAGFGVLLLTGGIGLLARELPAYSPFGL
jgi:cytochrome c-type biogenesis protein